MRGVGELITCPRFPRTNDRSHRSTGSTSNQQIHVDNVSEIARFEASASNQQVQCVCKQAEGLRCQQCVSGEQSQALRHQQASADIRVGSIVSSSQQVHRSCRRQQAIEVRGVGELITNRLPRTNNRSAASASSR